MLLFYTYGIFVYTHIEPALLRLVCMDSLSCRPLQKSLHGDGQLTQKPLDDWSALGKFIFNFNLQHVSHQSHKGVLLQVERQERCSFIFTFCIFTLFLRKVCSHNPSGTMWCVLTSPCHTGLVVLAIMEDRLSCPWWVNLGRPLLFPGWMDIFR